MPVLVGALWLKGLFPVNSGEAAIGSVDQKQLETLMARGLSPEEAVDVIVRGLFR